MTPQQKKRWSANVEKARRLLVNVGAEMEDGGEPGPLRNVVADAIRSAGEAKDALTAERTQDAP